MRLNTLVLFLQHGIIAQVEGVQVLYETTVPNSALGMPVVTLVVVVVVILRS